MSVWVLVCGGSDPQVALYGGGVTLDVGRTGVP